MLFSISSNWSIISDTNQSTYPYRRLRVPIIAVEMKFIKYAPFISLKYFGFNTFHGKYVLYIYINQHNTLISCTNIFIRYTQANVANKNYANVLLLFQIIKSIINLPVEWRVAAVVTCESVNFSYQWVCTVWILWIDVP